MDKINLGPITAQLWLDDSEFRLVQMMDGTKIGISLVALAPLTDVADVSGADLTCMSFSAQALGSQNKSSLRDDKGSMQSVSASVRCLAVR